MTIYTEMNIAGTKILKEKVQRGIYRHHLRLLFPRINNAQLDRAETFREGIIGRTSGYSPCLFSHEKKVLLTSIKWENRLSKEAWFSFAPKMAIQSHSRRAMWIIALDGKVIEFKGKTPLQFDLGKLNPNSGDPEGLLSLSAARNEAVGLRLIGEVECGVTNLFEYSSMYDGYAQLFRTVTNGSRYFPWLRIDSPVPVTAFLAELEAVSTERFLYESGERLGRQLKKLHEAGYTLHNPMRVGVVAGQTFRKPIWYSSLHSANVEIHGHLIDTEGMRTFEEAEALFWRRVHEDPKAIENIRERAMFESGVVPVPYYSRLCDFQRFLGGADRLEKSIAGVLGKDLFIGLFSGLINGYYSGRVSGEKLKQAVAGLLKKEKIGRVDLGTTHGILYQLEKAA
ncbi:MAG: hypothetical protein KKC80_03275 [Candidatus Margulisbacteria bacterium]|nr:hypothetical protein [Candidatus Margulisiibacteriota bacterium]MBU1616683.1 hypothetical protein [Candidatus Margulisiibacteriota bacterium]MBU1866948.1 hypothetical protein [Candidatus Margulisiibacteriota bacterium]